jgi:hypothetical protein
VILISIAYAWRDAPVGAFSEDLQGLMALVVQDTSKRIKDLLLYNIIPMLWPRHLTQFSAVLQTLVSDKDYRDHISTQIAKLHQSDKPHAQDVIQDWTVAGLHKIFNEPFIDDIDCGGNILLTISIALSKVPQYSFGEVDIELLSENQCNILAVVRHPETRVLVWDSCFDLASMNHKALYRLLLQTESNETADIIIRLMQLFVEQRNFDPISDPWLLQRQTRFLETEIEETVVEKALQLLLHNSARPDLQKFAFQALLNCGAQAPKRPHRKNLYIPFLLSEEEAYERIRGSIFRTLFVPLLATQGESEAIQKTVHVLLGIARQCYVLHRATFNITVNRMLKYRSPFTKSVASCLQQAILLDADHQWWGVQKSSPQRVFSVLVLLWRSGKLPLVFILRVVAGATLVALVAMVIVYFLFWVGWTFLGIVALAAIVGIGIWLYRQIVSPSMYSQLDRG